MKVSQCHKFKIGRLSQDDVSLAENYLIKREQDGQVKDKFDKGQLKSLRPYVDQDGVVEVGWLSSQGSRSDIVANFDEKLYSGLTLHQEST